MIALTSFALPRRRRGFSLAELLVVIVILAILGSIFIPYFLKLRQADHQVRCEDNLRAIMEGMRQYTALKDSHGKQLHVFPSVTHDAKNPGYTAYTGADSPNPFSKETKVKPNDVTASLWLLVRYNFVPANRFICPSTSQSVDPMLTGGHSVTADQRSNFTNGSHLSYSYASPFSRAGAKDYNLSEDSHDADFALLADKNPGVSGKQSNVALPPWSAQPFDLAKANSANHGRAGQNVLYADGHVAWSSTPYCGVGKEGRRDNIYTVLSRAPLAKSEHPPVESNGYFGRDVGPAWMNDSYLVPADGD